jgi:RHS repeat-associated protein
VRSPRYFDSSDVNGYEKCKTVMTYDGAGRVISRTEAPGTAEAGTETYTYDLDGRQKTRTDARGKIWTTTYASCCGHTVASKNPLGHGTITNQNAGGLTVHTAGVSDVDSHNSLLNPDDATTLQETTTLYDALGRSIASTVWLQPLGLVDVAAPPIAGFNGIAGTQGLTTQTQYDVDLTDNVGLETSTGLTVTNALGGTYTVSLSAAIAKLGEPVSQGGAGITFAAGTPGSAVVNTNAENEIRFSISDAQGRSLISGIVAKPSGAGTASQLRTWSCQVPDTTETIDSNVYLTSLSVDALGNTSKKRSNGLGHTLQSVDQAGNISTVQYDAGGNTIASRDPNNVGQDCVYDALGRRTQCTDTVGSVTKTGYDKAGQQITATDAKNKVTHYVFDARGRRRRETDRLNYPTDWEYDAAGNLLSLKDAENQITSYGYNDAGQRITEQYPDHVAGAAIGTPGYGIITFGYDALGRRVSKQDQQGDVTSYNFDMSGRMLTRGYVGHASGPLAGQTNTDTFTYDRAGRMLSGHKGRYNNTVTFSYDDRGQQTQETLTTHGQTYTVGYQKNLLGQTTQLQYPDGSLVDRAYTNRGQLQAVNYTPLAGAISSVATFTYDAGGRETSRLLGNGLTTSRSYFADNQIQSIATPTVETLTYTYDANKNPTSETRSGVMAPYSWSTGPTGYDDEDRLTNWARTNGDSQSWNLSPVHDWNSTTINGALQTRTHGPAHEILTMSGAGVTPTPATLTHDTKGNMTTDDRGCNMAWDFDNMMQSFNANGVTGLSNATYDYDAIGRRVAKNVAQPAGGTATTLFVQAGQQVTCEYTPGNAATDCDRKYAYGAYIDEAITVVNAPFANEVRYWLHQDRQYNTHIISAIDAQCASLYSYSPFGKRTSSTGAGPEVSIGAPLFSSSYTGREEDTESNLIYFRNRLYFPQSGSFLNRDLAGYDDGRNLHSRNFPLRSTDPYGTVATCEKKRCSGENVIPSGVVDPFGNGGKNVLGSIYYCYTFPRFGGDPRSCDGKVPIIWTEQEFAEHLFGNIEEALRLGIAGGNNPCNSDNIDWVCPLKCSGFEIRHHLGVRGKRVLDPDGKEIHAFFVTCNTCVTCKCKFPKNQECVCSRHGCTCF